MVPKEGGQNSTWTPGQQDRLPWLVVGHPLPVTLSPEKDTGIPSEEKEIWGRPCAVCFQMVALLSPGLPKPSRRLTSFAGWAAPATAIRADPQAADMIQIEKPEMVTFGQYTRCLATVEQETIRMFHSENLTVDQGYLERLEGDFVERVLDINRFHERFANGLFPIRRQVARREIARAKVNTLGRLGTPAAIDKPAACPGVA